MSRYYMINKPAGCITARKDDRHKVVMDYFSDIDTTNLNPVGRLDLDTEGLLLVTDDGKWNQELMKPESHIKKKYYFYVLGDLTDEIVRKLETGVVLTGETEKTKPTVIEIITKTELGKLPKSCQGRRYDAISRNKMDSVITEGYITITEGKKRQIKRMMKAVHCYIIYLKREAIGELLLDNSLKPGEYRELTRREIEAAKIR